MFSFELLLNVTAAGLLLGGFYAAVTIGLSLVFGLLDVVNIAHPVFVIMGSYVAFVFFENFGVDPLITGILFMPVFYLIGVVTYRIYFNCFEKKGAESLRGLVFFFGLLFIIEVGLIIIYGVDYRLLEPSYIGKSIVIGNVSMASRLLVPFAGGCLLTLALHLFLSKTFYGKAIKAVSQDGLALSLMGANPVKIKTIAFGIGIATASLAGALLIILATVEPSINREYIGRVFAIVVLGGMGSISGTLVASLILGLAESLTSTFIGPSWALAVSFGILMIVLAVRPAGLFGRSGT